MRYRVGEVVWYWPAAYPDTMPPYAAVIIAEQQSNVYVLRTMLPPGAGRDTDNLTAVDADDPATTLSDPAQVHRFRHRDSEWP